MKWVRIYNCFCFVNFQGILVTSKLFLKFKSLWSNLNLKYNAISSVELSKLIFNRCILAIFESTPSSVEFILLQIGKKLYYSYTLSDCIVLSLNIIV